MIPNMRSILWFAAVVLLMGTAFAPAVSAQDVMQLDLAFKNGQLPTSPDQGGAADLQDRRQDARAAQKPLTATRRHPRRHRRHAT